MKWILLKDNENFELKQWDIVEIKKTELTENMWYYTCIANNPNRQPLLKEWIDFDFTDK